jgi:cupin 2 domain-containing protein
MNHPTNNLFANLSAQLPQELCEVLAESSSRAVRIERIVSTGHHSPPDFWYDQHQQEWVVVLQGQARVSYDDGRWWTLGPGDYLLIPARQKHRVDWTSPDQPTVWLAIFF